MVKINKQIIMLSIFCVTLIWVAALQAATIYVPRDYATIQEGIDAASNSDVVLVYDNTYNENIDFKGKSITVKSINGPAVTIIDGQATARVVTFVSNTGAVAVLDGFTLRNGKADRGGGILARGGSFTVINNRITSNTAPTGGGVCLDGFSGKFANNTVNNNRATVGAGLYCGDLQATGEIISNTIASNIAGNSGAGVYVVSSSGKFHRNNIRNNSVKNSAGALTGAGGGGYFTVFTGLFSNNSITDNKAKIAGGAYLSDCKTDSSFINCTVANNTTTGAGGGFYVTGLEGEIKNTIIWGNTNQAIFSMDALTRVTYCDIKQPGAGTFPGTGNINADPLFMTVNDYRLQGASPCIDTGTNIGAPLNDMEGENRPQDGNSDGAATTDIGSDEYGAEPTVLVFTNQASFKTGETVEVSPKVFAGQVPVPVDVYVRIILPTGEVLYYPTFDVTPVTVAASWTPEDWGPQVLFSYTFDGTEPSGEYTIEVYFTQPGTINVIGRINTVNFTFSSAAQAASVVRKSLNLITSSRMKRSPGLNMGSQKISTNSMS